MLDGYRWNQEPQELVKKAGLTILHAERTLLVFSTRWLFRLERRKFARNRLTISKCFFAV